MEKTKNLNSMEVAEAGDIYLEFSGLLNWDKYKLLTTEEVKEWVEADTKRRANEWVKSHFKEEPFNGILYVATTYICLDYRYEKQDTVRASYEIGYAKNGVTSYVEELYQIFHDGKN